MRVVHCASAETSRSSSKWSSVLLLRRAEGAWVEDGLDGDDLPGLDLVPRTHEQVGSGRLQVVYHAHVVSVREDLLDVVLPPILPQHLDEVEWLAEGLPAWAADSDLVMKVLERRVVALAVESLDV